jgi:hypothetical protein
MAFGLFLKRWTIGLTTLLFTSWMGVAGQEATRHGNPYKITIQAEKTVVVEAALPIDPTPRIRFQPAGLVAQITDEQGRRLHLSHFPTLNVDGQIYQYGGFGGGGVQQGRFEKENHPLGHTAAGRARQGFTSVFVANKDLRVTYICEVVPTRVRGKAAKRRSDAVLCRYLVENKGQKSYKFGMRIYMDVYVINNDGAVFAAPNQPGKILDGVELKDKTLPDYLQMLQQPNLQNPGFVAHLTLNLGNSLEKPARVVLTRHGAGLGQWDMQPQASMGDSACGIFWEPKEIKPGGKREFAYGYGEGVVLPPEGEGQYDVRLGGSFAPGKLFSVTALISDPSPGQALTLELPEGIEAVEGRSIQPVPPPPHDAPNTVVMWKARVTRAGTFALRIRSNNGMTQTKIVTVARVP